MASLFTFSALEDEVLYASWSEVRMALDDWAVYMVNLRVRTCSCGRYQRNGVPCGHAMACLFRQGLPLDTFLPASLSIKTWAATYEAPLPPIDITGLRPQEEEACNLPLTRVPRGRPKRKRQERATYRAPRALHREDLGVGIKFICPYINVFEGTEAAYYVADIGALDGNGLYSRQTTLIIHSYSDPAPNVYKDVNTIVSLNNDAIAGLFITSIDPNISDAYGAFSNLWTIFTADMSTVTKANAGG